MITDSDSVSDGSDATALRGKSDESKSSGETYSNTSRANVDSTSQQLGLHETKIVRSSKVCVYVFLLLVAIGGSLLTWLFLKEEEQLSLAQQFDVLAKEILAVSTLNALSIFALYEAEALQITTHAMTTGQQWPFFSLDMFEVEADLLYNQTRTGDYIALHPIVKADQRLAWEKYAISNQGWIQDAYDFYGVSGTPSSICPVISASSTTCTPADNRTEGIYAPVWQIAPTPGVNERFINYDGLSSESFSTSFHRMMETGNVIVADAVSLEREDGFPLSLLMTPIHQGIRRESPIVAVLVGVIPWNDFFENLLPEGEDGIIVVVSNERQSFSFEINGPLVDYLGSGDLHDPRYDSFVNDNDFAAFANGTSGLGFVVSVYPTQEFEDEHIDNSTLVYTLAVAFVFLFAMSVFFVYDFFVEQRQTKVMLTATKSSAIVNSLFPANVRDRLMEEHAVQTGDKKFTSFQAAGLEDIPSSKPIADLFPEATVMFADLAGFTAWSSIREPSQVFFLLESLYNSFDKIARKMKVFKVETIGDSYVAVAGLPDPRKDHAEVMARFGHKCLVKTNTLMHALETTLGPGTSELKMRIGLHSGPVTAGVLRGEKSRFQLFGDTVNTAARMESTGIKNRIHLSKETADLIVAGGKEHWIKPRSTKVFAKGKGELQTFWYAQGTDSDTTDDSEAANLTCREGNNSPTLSSMALNDTQSRACSERLVIWNVENLCLPLKKLIASRRKGQKPLSAEAWRKLKVQSIHPDKIVLDEVEEVITLPENGVVDFGPIVDSVVLDKEVVDQLTNYVTTISSMYRPHAFHNFDHASHVAQSVTKLLSRVVTPDQINYESLSYTPKAAPDKLHDFTFGITSNPLIHFAVILSALIHDVDHPGVPNATLVKEGSDMAITYKNKSVAEQNSVDLAWGLLMEPQYEDLRRCIYGTQQELESFRKLLVNAVLATDVVDTELGNLRKRRWDLAFQTETTDVANNDSSMTNRKATIVIEYLIQASDVAHTMQHWQIYTHWNEKFFQECYKAYKDGRSDKDPTEGWYEGELGFFDFYVIPLARRLKDCGVFGVSSAEYLNYAVSNREEWSRRGKEMVALYLEGLGITTA